MTLSITHAVVASDPQDPLIGADEWNDDHTITGTIDPVNGGTGTATVFTEGSIVFAGASGVYSQDNANFYWDDTNNRLGIGTNAPSASVHIINTGASDSFRVDDQAADTSPFVIDASGNVGIGTSAPAAKLHVETAGNSGIRIFNTSYPGEYVDLGGGSGYLRVKPTSAAYGVLARSSSNDSYYVSLTAYNGYARLRYLETTGLVLDVNGYAGINTTGPDRRLDVLDASNPQLRLTHTDGSVYTDLQTDGSGNLIVSTSGTYTGFTNPTLRLGSQSTYISATANNSTTSVNGRGVMITTGSGTQGANALTVIGGSSNESVSNIESRHGFAPNSGSNTFNGVYVNSTINQTGGANGITRGLYVNPTLTAAADWRSVDIANNSGYGIYQSGTSAKNYFAGNVGIGTTGPDAKLDVLATTEQLRLTYTDGSVYAAFTVNSAGDLTINPTGSDVKAPIFEGTSAVRSTVTNGFIFGSHGRIKAPTGDGIFQMTNNLENNFSRLQLGGSTSSFPAIKRNGAGIDIRLADDSAYAALTTGDLVVSGNGIYTKQIVTANTAGSGSPKVLTAAETNSVWTNEGATAKNYYTLPTAAAGYQFTFIVQDADGIRVVANTGDTINLAGTVSASAGYAESTTIGSAITLVAINATEWIATSFTGTWSVT